MSEGQKAPTAGVVGDDSSVADALSAAGIRPVAGGVDTALAAEPSLLVAVGESALTALASRRPLAPVLPVAAGRGVRSVPRAAVGDAAERLATGDWRLDRHPLLGVETPDDRTAVLFDAMLVTAEPADISEFTLHTGDDPVAQFRADGVVVATPAGTPGYSRAAGGPIAPPGLGVLVVVPVAPFATSLGHWVLPADCLTVTVERDEAPVEVLADDRSAGVASVGDPIRLAPDGRVDLVRVPEGRSPFGSEDDELETL